MKEFPFFNLEKVLFLSYRPSKLSYEVEVWYVHLIGIMDVSFEDFNFSADMASQPTAKSQKFKKFLFSSNFYRTESR